ncbi:antibiotic biosynthesis monooxygenase [Saccharopolyspora sp. NFXS83]|uniref:antibiotic biosynthesis monooxygenase family protein n=1 Tax=Saccharopolyspora sp. NFXS83 TaxID=2993560 RepID=UPI00224A9730|nr:antibiotic biosynthesis monooxygenase family protein [Saccharopolyspora sp. NFXS83]MCX2733855.1 antibiotic biosynthesis monooxygenase [Saccharopolyspora sp. NFXS83]
MPSTIEQNAPLATLINVFTVRPERQRELVDLLNRATEEVMITLPGFVSANIHASTDGTKVVNYAQWSDADAFQAMLANPVAQPHMSAAAEVAKSYEPHLYAVDAVHSVDDI